MPKTDPAVDGASAPKIAAIRVTGPEKGRWRGQYGTPRHFTPEPQTFSEESGLTEEELIELMSDPELKVEFLDADGNAVPTPPLPPRLAAPAT